MGYKAIATPITDLTEPRDSIDGGAWMPQGASTPTCRRCQSLMQLFFQFDIEQRFDLPFKAGGHFVLFMCPLCNEIPSFESFPGGALPEDYWNRTEGNHYAALYRSGSANALARSNNSLLRAFKLDFVDNGPELHSRPSIRIGGDPQWLQDAEDFTCSCGAKMKLLTQVSENFPFPKTPSAPSQPGSFSKDDYCLFLGNEVYVFACEKQCDERAIWITVQN